MRELTATEASRGFKELLDAVERGETIVITRGRRPIAEIRPAERATGAALASTLGSRPRLDVAFASDISAALDLVDEQADPWVDA